MNEMQKKNMALWDSVCTTNPEDTKRVNQRGGFTAICAQSQLREATKEFGPFGLRWYVHDEKFSFLDHGVCLYQAILIIGDSSTCINSSIQWVKSDRPDADFSKKLSTDALTKALSRMGFNADVFLGKFDDNKYVQEQKEKHAEPIELSEKIKFIQGVQAMMGPDAPKTADDWQDYVKPLCDAIGEKIVSIKDIKDDSALWSKLSDKSVEEYTKND